MEQIIKEHANEVNRQWPQWLQRNRVSDVFKFTQALVARLKAAGYKVSYVGKTRGEGQYTPFDWTPKVINGFTITGISHDALWIEGKQYDCVGQANDEEHEIFYPDGRHMEAKPDGSEVPSKYWRSNNPPVDLAGNVTFEPPIIVQPPKKQYPGDHVGTKCMEQLFADYATKGEAPNAGMGVWVWRVAWQVAQEGLSPEEAVDNQRNSERGWKKALGI